MAPTLVLFIGLPLDNVISVYIQKLYVHYIITVF